MTKNKIKEALLNCDTIKTDIMDKIDKKLNTEGIVFIHNNQSEIIVPNGDKKTIKGLIATISEVSKDQIKMILQISESNGKLFIRQKFN